MTQFKSTRKVSSKREGLTPDEQARDRFGRFFFTFVKDRKCSQCWGNMQVEVINGREKLVCPEGCQPGGHVSSEYVEIARSKNESEARDVAHAYPYFDGSEEIIGEKLTGIELREAAREGKETLFE